MRGISGKELRQHPLVVASCVTGLAVSPDSALLALALSNLTIAVYSLPDVTLIRVVDPFPAEVKRVHCSFDKICFSATGTLLVCEQHNSVVEELTLAGEHVRFIGERVLDTPGGLTADCRYIIVGQGDAVNDPQRIAVFDAATGEHVKSFGQIADDGYGVIYAAYGLRLSPDGTHVAVVDCGYGEDASQLYVFRTDGTFVTVLDDESLRGGTDVDFADNGDVLVTSCSAGNVRVLRLSCPSGGGEASLTPLLSWSMDASDTDEGVDEDADEGDPDEGDGWSVPVALAVAGGLLYTVQNRLTYDGLPRGTRLTIYE